VLKYLFKRSLYMIVTLIVVSLVAFIIIQLPPGDYATSLISSLSASGTTVSQEMLENLRVQYGLNESPIIQYGKWMWGIITRGDFGLSFSYNQPVSAMIWDRVWLTAGISLLCVLITWMIAFPIGIFSAVRQYSLADYIFTFIGFIGVSVPSFLVALIVMYVAFKVYGVTITGLFSSRFLDAPWSLERLGDLISHLWIPVLILALEGTAGLGMEEWKLLIKYPVRAALNPFVSTLGWLLPGLVSGSIIISVVMALPTTGPLLLSSLMSQDMYLAGTIIMLLSVLTVVGTLISDILLALLDPRIRFQ
jgi:peptide/nickel transport system permease protein